MNAPSIVFASTGAALVLFAVLLLIRNERVFQYRSGLLDGVRRAVQLDIERGFYTWMWRYDALRAVSYPAMVWRFWVPLDRFYSDQSFLSPGAARPEAVQS